MNRENEIVLMLNSLGEEEFILALRAKIILNRYQKHLDKEEMKKEILEKFENDFDKIYSKL